MVSPIKSSIKKDVPNMNFSESSKDDSDTHIVHVVPFSDKKQTLFESKIPSIKQLSYGSKILTTPISAKKPVETATPVDPRQFYQSMLETSITSITATGRRTRQSRIEKPKPMDPVEEQTVSR